jgi:hypothetical protein
METGSDVKRIIRGVLGGGLSAVVTLFALMVTFAVATNEPVKYPELALTVATLIAGSLVTIWATGFWGRWGMALFFISVPVAIIIDYTINPLFPLGVIVFASLCYGARKASSGNA